MRAAANYAFVNRQIMAAETNGEPANDLTSAQAIDGYFQSVGGTGGTVTLESRTIPRSARWA